MPRDDVVEKERAVGSKSESDVDRVIWEGVEIAIAGRVLVVERAVVGRWMSVRREKERVRARVEVEDEVGRSRAVTLVREGCAAIWRTVINALLFVSRRLVVEKGL